MPDMLPVFAAQLRSLLSQPACHIEAWSVMEAVFVDVVQARLTLELRKRAGACLLGVSSLVVTRSCN